MPPADPIVGNKMTANKEEPSIKDLKERNMRNLPFSVQIFY
jgi:hypothetical protein